MKKYKLLIEGLDCPIGSEARYDGGYYSLYLPSGQLFCSMLYPEQVENRPSVWEEITEKEQTKEEVNQWLPFEPKYEEDYWYVRIGSEIDCETNEYTNSDIDNTHCGVFRTKEAAEMEALRRKSMAKRWKPKIGDKYWYYGFDSEQIIYDIWGCANAKIEDFFIGNTHKTKEDAEKWRDAYAKAWEVLL